MILGVLAGCDHYREPPPSLSFDSLPVSGSLADALRAGFRTCLANDTDMRCRRNNVMFKGKGPYSAAVEFGRSDGSGGFDQLTLWHDRNQNAVFAIANELKHQGWRECFTGGRWGNQAIYTHDGSPVFVSMDLSYWAKRRLRVIPAWKRREPRC